MNIITKFLHDTNLDNSLLIGYYGGANYGDELLLETLQLLLVKYGVRDVKIYYSNVPIFDTYHHNFGYQIVDITSKKIKLIKEFFQSKNILIGGGGIWGLDANVNVFLLSLLLFVVRVFLGKNVYLLNVGYYNSTSRLGHISAYLTAKSATHIFARDVETYQNFLRYNKYTTLDSDLIFYLDDVELEQYSKESEIITKKLGLETKRTLIGLRRFQKKYKNSYIKLIFSYIEKHPDELFTVMIFESRDMARDLWKRLKFFSSKNAHVIISDYSFNPISFLYSLKSNHKNLKVIAPQYHVQISAYLAHIPFLPIDYDNKNTEFFKKVGIDKAIDINRFPPSFENTDFYFENK